MSVYIKTGLVFLASISTLSLAACISDGGRVDVNGDDAKQICEKYCSNIPKPDPEVFVLTNRKQDGNNTEKFPHSQIYVKTEDGLLSAPNKRIGLDERCFAKDDFPAPHLRGVNLTTENTSIIFINFTKDGRLESRNMMENIGSKGGNVYNRINNILTTSQGGEYSLIQKHLEDLVKSTSDKGRPTWDSIQYEGFEVKNMNGTPLDKTPFYTKLGVVDGTQGEGQKEHIFFYVLLDNELRFMRDTAAMLPYAPHAKNSIGQLYSPYIQYPIVPEDPALEPDSVDVMTVHFYRGGGMTDGMENEGMGDQIIPASCVYPYDIGVIANGQKTKTNGLVGFLKTPQLIDPEVEAEGILLD